MHLNGENDGGNLPETGKMDRKFMLLKTRGPFGAENAHLKPDLGAFSHHELTLNTHIPLLTSLVSFRSLFSHV